MSVYETSITNPKKQLEFYKDLSEQLEKYNQELKKENESLRQLQCTFLGTGCKRKMEEYESQQKEFIEWLEKEKDRLERKCSHIYEDGLGKVKLVSEDVHDEMSRILSKYKEIVGGNNDQ